MPKKQKTTREEKFAENFFPVEPGKIKYSVEKEYKSKDFSKIIQIEKKEKRKTIITKRKKKKDFKYSGEKILLDKKGYELIITEKPQAASKIAYALGKPIQKTSNKVYYYELKDENIVVACAVGHLLTLKQTKTGTEVPIFEIKWIPNYLARKKDFTKRYYDLIKQLTKKASKITIATDYDVEGEVIGMNVARFICGQKDANRMKFSSLTEKEIKQAYEKKKSTINWGQAIAGETRHYLDWFYGINLSRALMNAIKTTGSFRIMSIGRVQGPALKLIVDKEKEIQKFKPETYWQIFIKINDDKNKIELKYIKDIFNKSELKNFENIKNQKVKTSTEKKQEIIPPHPPFNLTTLQTEAYKFHGITPSNTLKSAQSLYLSGLISYPRTSSQKLPESIDYQNILKIISKEYNAEKLITRKKPIQGKKTDPAHPSIYPTGNKQIVSGDEEKIYNLVAKRFLALFCDDAIIDKKKIKAITEKNYIFSTNGSSINKKGWMSIYPSKSKENQIPDFQGEAEIIESRIEEKQTQPPKRYSQASIISILEKKNIGTKSTRSNIIETLYERGYINGQSILATPLGLSLIETLEKYSPIIIDEKLTRKFEKEMDLIIGSKKDHEKEKEKIIEEAKKTIIKISKDFEKKEKNIGEELLQAQKEQREIQKKENYLTLCKKCEKGNLAITYSKKTKRYFVACDAYPDCKNTFSLPPNSNIKKLEKSCEDCNFPLLISLKKGKKPWIFCFNPECPKNKKRIEEYKKNLN